MPTAPKNKAFDTFKKLVTLGIDIFSDPPTMETDDGIKSAWLVKASALMVSGELVQRHPIIKVLNVGTN